MSAIGNPRLVIKVCEMYYLLDMSQKEIASRLKLSRPHVCRIIAQARSSGIVEISIKNPNKSDTDLEHRLVQTFGLQDAFVVTASDAEKSERDRQFSREAANYLDTFLSNDMQVGVMSGKTIFAIAQQMHSPGTRLGYIVPLVGGIGTGNSNLHANSIAMQIASAYHGTSMVINAPSMVSSAEAASILRQEASVSEVLEKGRHCDVTIVGIGNADANSTTAQAGGITMDDLRALKAAGAVSSVCSSYYDKNGNEVDVLTDRSIGLRLSDLKRSRVIACALGQSKVAAIHATLLTKRLDVLMTDSETARSLLNY
ncbi:MAG: sugar-binding transcriptional regulator [Clostridia bacterium]|nr:sugar-binding transcriptional regulator [Clostridia bacterium]